MGNGSESGAGIHALCRSCGRPSPTTLNACPTCGAALPTVRSSEPTDEDIEALPTGGEPPDEDWEAPPPTIGDLSSSSSPAADATVVGRKSPGDLTVVERSPEPQPAGPEANVHIAETLLLDVRNVRARLHETPTVNRDDHTRIDATPYGRSAGTKLQIDDIQVSALPSFDDSDEHTRAELRRLHVVTRRPAGAAPGASPSPAGPEDLPAAITPTNMLVVGDSLPGIESSDPPTKAGQRRHLDLPPGSLVDETYEIERRLGAGAMGEVYVARHLKLNKRVAIKTIAPRISEDAGAIERFEREARTLAQLQHPGIVDVTGFGELPDGRAYFVMAFVAGESLEDRLARDRIPFEEGIDILDQIACALDVAHHAGVVHRDLKPANVFLAITPREPRPIVKLLDFGLSKLTLEVDQRLQQTASGVVIGTPLYISPEQARGPDVDGRTDLYALGCVAYEVLLGRVPFPHARTVASLLAAHLHETPPMPRSIWPEIPAAIDLLLFGLLAKDAAHRPTLPQVRHVIASLRSSTSFSGLKNPTAHARAATELAAAPSSRRTTLAIACAAMFAGIAIGVVMDGRSDAHKPDVVTGGSAAPIPRIGLPAEPSTPAQPVRPGPPPTTLRSVGAASLEAGVAEIPAPSVVGGTDAMPQSPTTIVPDASVATLPAVPVDAPSRTSLTAPRDATAVAATSPPKPARDIVIIDAKPAALGGLSLTSTPICDITIDGKPSGRTPSTRSIAAGHHRVELGCATGKVNFPVDVLAGKVTTSNHDFSDHVTLNPFPQKQPR